MEFLIGKVSQEFLADVQDEVFSSTDGKTFYWYKAELDDDGLRITDTVGRTLPIDEDSFVEFARLFRNLAAYKEVKENAMSEMKDALLYGSTPC